MKHINLLSALLLPFVFTCALAQSTGESVKVAKGVVSSIESAEMTSADHSQDGAVVGAAVGYGLSGGGSPGSVILGAGVGAAAGSSKTSAGMRYTVSIADGTSIAVVTEEVPNVQVGSCVSVEQSTDRATIRGVDQAVCDLEAQTAVPVSKPQTAVPVSQPQSDAPESQSQNTGQSENCLIAQQQLLDATTAEALELANSKVKALCK